MESEVINLASLHPLALDPHTGPSARQSTSEIESQRPRPKQSYLQRRKQAIFGEKQAKDDVLNRLLEDEIQATEQYLKALNPNPTRLEKQVFHELERTYRRSKRIPGEIANTLHPPVRYQAFAPPMIRCWRHVCTNESATQCEQELKIDLCRGNSTDIDRRRRHFGHRKRKSFFNISYKAFSPAQQQAPSRLSDCVTAGNLAFYY